MSNSTLNPQNVKSLLNISLNVEIRQIVDLQLAAHPDQRSTCYFSLNGKTYTLRTFVIQGEPSFLLDPTLPRMSYKRRVALLRAILDQEKTWRESNPPMAFVDRAFVEVQA